MNREELERRWAVTRGHLEAARREIRSVGLSPAGVGALARFADYLGHNELELALDELEGAGGDDTSNLDFWESLVQAADSMSLFERASTLRGRIGAILHERHRRGWPVPTVLRPRDEDLWVYPWPGRDEAFVLFDIEDLGPAGPAACSLALLRGRDAPEVVWRSQPFVVFLDECWLGTEHSVWFTVGADYAFARPYLRGRYDACHLIVVRATDHRCAILETPFPVLRAEALGATGFRVHALPDPSMRELKPEHRAEAAAIPPVEVQDSALDWFVGAELRARVNRIKETRTDIASKPPKK